MIKIGSLKSSTKNFGVMLIERQKKVFNVKVFGDTWECDQWIGKRNVGLKNHRE